MRRDVDTTRAHQDDDDDEGKWERALMFACDDLELSHRRD